MNKEYLKDFIETPEVMYYYWILRLFINFVKLIIFIN